MFDDELTEEKGERRFIRRIINVTGNKGFLTHVSCGGGSEDV